MEMTDQGTADGVVRVALSGRMDAEGLEGFDARFMDAVTAPGKPAIVDFSDVAFMASLGMRLLIQTAKALAAKNARLVILRPQPVVAEVLKIAGLAGLAPIADDESQALALATGTAS